MDINISSIKYDTACINITPIGVVCDICQSKLDIHTKKISQKVNKRDKITNQTDANNIG